MKTFVRNQFLILVILIGVPSPTALTIEPAKADAGKHAARKLEFNRDIRPILADKCFACHGPDSGKREADLRLDVEKSAKADLGGYRVIAEGDPEASLLVERILSEDPDEQMPPSDHFKQLSAAEKAALVEWVRDGAEWQAHWAYLPPQRHSTPRVDFPVSSSQSDTSQGDTSNSDESPSRSAQSGLGFGRNWIDAFVAAKLMENELTPAPVADPRTLLRRLSFDLTGLPPTRAEVEDLVDDPSYQNYEAHVDRLLRSPHFGERLAIYWLDLVRYADTVGYHGDQDVSISPYRDYVINSFNQNKPFDQFTREQLAGDLLPDATQEQLVASGYNRLGMMSAEGGVQPEEYLAKYAADRVRNASTVWLGSTLGCAECHDHKFDPFSAQDFYRFASFFADIKERGLYSGANRDGNWGPEIKVADVGLPILLEPIDAEIASLEQQLAADNEPLLKAKSEWERAMIASLNSWAPIVPTEATGEGTELKILKDGSILASGASPATSTYRVVLEFTNKVTALRLTALPDESLPAKGPGRAGNGNFVVTELKLSKLADSEGGAKLKPIQFSGATAGWEQANSSAGSPYKTWSANAAVDSDKHSEEWGWAILPRVGQANWLVADLEDSLAPGRYELLIEQKHSNPKHTLGKFRLASTTQRSLPTIAAEPELSTEVREALLIDASKRTVHQSQIVDDAFRRSTPLLKNVRDRLAKAQSERKELVKRHTRSTLITVAVEPREMRVLPRGNWMDKSGEVVSPGVPKFLFPLETSGRATRLDLANWLVDRQNPITARVMVNRLWKLCFGTGISKSLDDVGSQGEVPTHPELLDTLAVEFMESGWDIKHMLKLIVMSSTYRQSSLYRPEVASVDPYNRLLARQSRFRLDAEMIRDNALAVSELLVRQVGGRSVKPYQPAGLLRHLNFPKRVYKQDDGANQYRRGVYTHWQRQFLHPAMQAFDAPAREECTAERPRSNTPLAALVLLNDPSYVEAARCFAEQVIQEGGEEVPQRLQWMMNQALCRDASSEEIAVFKTLLESELAAFESDSVRAKELVSVGLSAPSSECSPIELAAWTSVTRALLNMHEVVTRN